jgi:hypothetical protein
MVVEDNVDPEIVTEYHLQGLSLSDRLGSRDDARFSTDLSSQCDMQSHLSAFADHDSRSSTSSFFDSWDSQEHHDFLEESLIWKKKAVLSCGVFALLQVKWASILTSRVGGGGPRGLYQLYLLKALMERVEFYELSLDEQNKATSSADSPLLRFHSDKSDHCQPRSRVPTVEGIYLPCHYFDYIGGTSVGG